MREALTTSGTRTVVFDVSGNIPLSSTIYVANGNLTVAGQTAPSPGIQVTGSGIEINAGNVIVQHLRARISGGTQDGIRVFANGSDISNVIIDHCTVQWATDENISVTSTGTASVNSVTVSNCLMGEAIYGTLLSNDAGSLNEGLNHSISIVKNLYAHHSERHPGIGDNTYAAIANNLIYNPKWEGSVLDGVIDEGSKGTWRGNHYKTGADSLTSPCLSAVSGWSAEVYENDNITSGPVSRSITSANFDAITVGSEPVSTANITVLASSEVLSHVSAKAGAWPAARDAEETSLVSDAVNGTGSQVFSGTPPAYAENTSTWVEPDNPSEVINAQGWTALDLALYLAAQSVEN